jgi:hypothetical protein
MKKHILILVMIAVTSVTWSQSTTVTAGGDHATTEGGISFSIGIPVYTYSEGNNGSVTQGVQHTYEIENLSTAEFATLSVNVYPNPTVGTVTLEYDGTFSYRLLDSRGAVLSEGYGEHGIKLEMYSLPASVYYLVVTDEKNSSSFKIIKN